MYLQLELQYNNDGLTQLEDRIRLDQRELQSVYDDTRAQLRARKDHDKYLKKEEDKTNKFKGQVSVVKRNLKEEKQKVNQQIALNRSLISNIKNTHSEILALEEKIVYATNIIKKKKQEGRTPEESKRLETQKL